MPVEVHSYEELIRITNSKKLVLVAIYDPLTPTGRYVSSLMDTLSLTFEPGIVIVKVDSRANPEIVERLAPSSREPRLVLFLDGKPIWEQIGFFTNIAADKYAIRRGILNALKQHGLTPKRLGIRLRDRLDEL